MTGGMDKYWIIPRVGDKELPRVGHQLASCSLINSYVLMFLRFMIMFYNYVCTGLFVAMYINIHSICEVSQNLRLF